MADTHAHGHEAPKHPYHLVDPSPWPIVGSLSALTLAVGGVMYLHDAGAVVMAIGFLMVLFTMAMWWRDVIREANSGRYHTPIVRIGLRYGMALFIISEVMFFSAFFWAFFSSALFPSEAIGHVWPPTNIQVFDPWELPFVNTLILLLSGVTVTWAHHALLENNRRDLIRGLTLTVLLGLTFTACQAFEYTHAGFGFKDGIYASTFYMATGFHGFHVIVGTIFLAVCLFRSMKGDFTPQQHVGFEAAAWYWHFVDVVWLFLFMCIYWWGGYGGAVHAG